MISRRKFLKYVPTIILTTKYKPVFANNNNIINYKITAKKSKNIDNNIIKIIRLKIKIN